jgi:hypothetical protein
VLVFDCVALRLEEGIVVCFPERMGKCFSYALGNVWTLLGFSGHPLFPKERCFLRML